MPHAVIHQFLIIMGLLVVGYACRKLDVIDDTGNRHLSKFLLCLTIPATAIDAAIGQPIENLTLVLAMLGVSAAVFVVVPIVAGVVCKLLSYNDIYRLMIVFGNTGFVGIPVVSALYGDENVFFVTLYIMVFNIAFFTWGVSVMKRTSGYQRTSSTDAAASSGTRLLHSLRELINPGIVSALIALAIFAVQLPVPSLIHELISTVARMNTPLALIVIGASIANVSMRDVFADGRLYLFCVIKLLVIPALTLAVLWFTPLDRTLVSIFVTLAAMPVAGNVSMIAIQYGGDIDLVSKGTALTTLLFIPAVMLWTTILGLL